MTKHPPTIKEAAIAALHAGLSVIPVKPKTKAPPDTWKQYQVQPMTPEHAETLTWAGMGIVCGAVSGNVECFDFDHKARFLAPWKALADAEAPGLTDRLTRQMTQSGGRHVIYRCPGVEIPGSMKLARDKIEVPGPGMHEYEGKPYTAEQEDGRWYVFLCLIETRGTGGQFLADPTPGYQLLNGCWEEIPIVTPEERKIMLRAARALDRAPAKPKHERGPIIDGNRPGDWFSENIDPWPILDRHGWTDTGISKGEFRHVRRPGKTGGWSASVVDGKILKVFSTNADPFEEKGVYNSFQISALLDYGGDFSAAARAAKAEQDRSAPDVTARKPIRHSQETTNDKGYVDCDGSDPTSGDENEKCNSLPRPPLHVFHPSAARLIEEVAAAKSAPIEAAIAPFLAVIAAMIGRVCAIRIKRGWREYGNLYIALIALSGTGKSPVTSFFFRAIRKLEKLFQSAFESALERYELELLQWQKESKKNDLVQRPKPARPQREDLLVDDWTTESLTDTLDANPYGILAYRDELAGLLQELDKYSSGSSGGTKNRLMSAYDCGPWKTSRVNQNRVSYIPEACVSIYGTIQPVQAKEIFTAIDKVSGFLSRFLTINAALKAPAYFTEKSESEEAVRTIEKLVERLYAIRKGNNTGQEYPIIIDCDREAKSYYIKWHDKLALEAWLGPEDNEDSLLAKLRGQCLRIALQLHLTDAILDEKPIEAPVSLDVMQRACELSDWLKSHQRYAWQMLKGAAAMPTGKELRVAQAVVALESEIENSFIATARIVEAVNATTKAPFRLAPGTVGKTCSRLGLEQSRTRTSKGWSIGPDDLVRLRELLEPGVTSGTSVKNQTEQRLTGVPDKNAGVTSVTKPGDQLGPGWEVF
jgi:hypothetical protein